MTIDTRFREMPEPGVYRGVAGPHYHGWKAVSSSRIRKPTRGYTPLHLKHELDHPESTTKAAEFGNLGHVLVLQPELYEDLYANDPPGSKNSNAYKAAAQAIVSQRPFATLVSDADVERAKAAKAAIERHPLAGELFREAETELTLVWDEEVPLFDDSVEMVRCKARLDSVLDGIGVTDLKFTGDTRDDPIRRVSKDKRYDIQAAFYLRGTTRLFHQLAELGIRIPEFQPFAFCFVEMTEPHDVRVLRPKSATITNADDEVTVMLQIWATCQKTGIWPGSLPFIDELPEDTYFGKDAPLRIQRLQEFLHEVEAAA